MHTYQDLNDNCTNLLLGVADCVHGPDAKVQEKEDLVNHLQQQRLAPANALKKP
jgi:hypothetical protein